MTALMRELRPRRPFSRPDNLMGGKIKGNKCHGKCIIKWRSLSASPNIPFVFGLNYATYSMAVLPYILMANTWKWRPQSVYFYGFMCERERAGWVSSAIPFPSCDVPLWQRAYVRPDMTILWHYTVLYVYCGLAGAFGWRVLPAILSIH